MAPIMNQPAVLPTDPPTNLLGRRLGQPMGLLMNQQAAAETGRVVCIPDVVRVKAIAATRKTIFGRSAEAIAHPA